MIIISTNNGGDVLPALLNSLEGCNRDVCIVDTGSTDRSFINYLDNLTKKNTYSYNINIHKTPYPYRDTGAIIYAIKNIEAERYYFIHDSCVVVEKDLFDLIDEKIGYNQVLAICGRISKHDGAEHVYDSWMLKYFGECRSIEGILGPMWAGLRCTLLKLNLEAIPPTPSKHDACAMERGWSVVLKNAGVNIWPPHEEPLAQHIHILKKFKKDYGQGTRDSIFLK